MYKNKKNEPNDELLDALKNVKKNSDFFRNSSFQGSELSTESMTTSANYLCGSIKREAEKKYYKKIYLILTELEGVKVPVLKLFKIELHTTASGIKYIPRDEERKIIEDYPELKEQINTTYSDIDEIQNQINAINWEDVSASFVKCKDFLKKIRVNGKKISTNYDEYISIADKIAKKV